MGSNPAHLKGPSFWCPAFLHQSASELLRDAICSRRSRPAAAFPGHGDRARRLWAARRRWARRPGWPPPVCSCRYPLPGPPQAVPQPGFAGIPPGADSVPLWIALRRGSVTGGVLQPEEVAAERRLPGSELGTCVQCPGWEVANKPLSF